MGQRGRVPVNARRVYKLGVSQCAQPACGYRERLVVSESADGAIFVESLLQWPSTIKSRPQWKKKRRRTSRAETGNNARRQWPAFWSSGARHQTERLVFGGRSHRRPRALCRHSTLFLSFAVTRCSPAAGHSSRPSLHLDLFILFVRERSIGSRLSRLAFFSLP